MNRFMSTQKNTASTDRQNGDRMMLTSLSQKIHQSLVKGNGDVRVNIHSLIDWMTWNDLRNDTFMSCVIIGPIYPFV